jgi:hypothetical protein
MKYNVNIKDDFNNLQDYQNWLSQQFKRLSPYNEQQTARFTKSQVDYMIKEYPDWYGKNVTYKELEAGVKEFINPQLLDTLYQKVNHELSSVIAQKLQARKLKFNALGFGMFCFDRAAMTLYKVKESERSNKLKVKTNTKELFAYFPEESREKHAVEFFISCGGSAGIKAHDLLYQGVSAIIMAELLIKAGFKIKINIILGYCSTQERDELFAISIPIKNYDEVLDRNSIALTTSDPRFFRYDGFKGLIAVGNYFDQKVPANIGYAFNKEQLKTLFEKSGYAKKSASKHRYYFGGTFSEDKTLEDITLTIEDIANKLLE